MISTILAILRQINKYGMNNRKDFDFDSKKGQKATLGLNKRAKKSFDDNGEREVLDTLDVMEPREAIEILRSHLKANPRVTLEDNKSTRDYLYVEVVCVNDTILGKDRSKKEKTHEYKLMFSLEAEEDSVTNQAFISWSPFVLFDGTFKKMFFDFVLPTTSICCTYSWNEIYVNYSSLPYKISSSNLRDMMRDLDEFISRSEKFASMMHKMLDGTKVFAIIYDALDRVVTETLEGFYTNNLWKHVKEHGGLVDGNESVGYACVAPAKILREAREINCPNVFERLERAIHNTTNHDVEVAPSIGFGYGDNNTISIMSKAHKVKRDIDMNQVREWSEVSSPDNMTDSDIALVEEEVAKAASKFLPVSSGIGKYREKLSGLGVI